MDFIAIINLTTMSILALLILTMRFEPSQFKFYWKMSALMTLAPLLVALLGNSAGLFSIDYLKIIRLEQGVFSIAIATGYGLVVGLLLNYLKVRIIALFRRESSEEIDHD